MDEYGNALYDLASLRACEKLALEYNGLDANALMQRAGKEAFGFIQTLYPHLKQLAIFCGGGNNGGDGYVVARLAKEAGLAVTVYQYRPIETLTGAAKEAAVLASAAAVPCKPHTAPLDPATDCIIDALLGIGLQHPLRPDMQELIQRINDSGLPVISLDIPSGLQAETGEVCPIAVKAARTLTFIAPKLGLFTLNGPDHCGVIHCCSLQLESCLAQLPIQTHILDVQTLPPLKPRLRNSHKGDFGSVLIIGGGRGMPGAASLCAKAALRVGAGMVTLATWPDHAKGALALVPEAMVWGVARASQLKPLLARASLCVVGPGLGLDSWAQSLLKTALASKLPMVVDASALRLLKQPKVAKDNWVLTPHVGEAASLLRCSTQSITSNRLQAAKQIQQAFGGVVVLKGVGTIIQGSQDSFLCRQGNAGMASAGMGDVLTGIIAGLMAQGVSQLDACNLGVWLHASVADKLAATFGERGILASDLLDPLPAHLNHRDDA